MHSPFVFALTESVLEDDRWYYAFSEIETLRKHMLADKRKIPVTDFGAGSQVEKSNERSIRSLARYSAHPPFVNRMLFRLVKHFKPGNMLELGTSLGISTAYQAAASLDAPLVTIEGCPQVAHLAAQHFKMMNIENVALLEGRFDEMLPVALENFEKLDYVFVDGNHRKEPTLAYFEKCLEYAHMGSVFVFDDIHWSASMEAAWEEIKAHPKVKITVDLFFFGVVFFREEQQVKEHFTLVKWSWKPWRVGFLDLFR